MSFLSSSYSGINTSLKRTARVGLWVGVGLSAVLGIAVLVGFIKLATLLSQYKASMSYYYYSDDPLMGMSPAVLVIWGLVLFILILGAGSFYSWRRSLRHYAIASMTKDEPRRQPVYGGQPSYTPNSYPTYQQQVQSAPYGGYPQQDGSGQGYNAGYQQQNGFDGQTQGSGFTS